MPRFSSLSSDGTDDAEEPLINDQPSPQRPAPARGSQESAGLVANDALARRPSGPQAAAPPQPRGPPRISEERRLAYEAAERQRELKYGADSILSLVLPVSLCMVVVIATIRSVKFFTTHDTQLAYTPMHENDDQSTAQRAGNALLNVTIVISIVIAMTMLLVTCYKYRCYKAIHLWLLMVSFLLLFFMSSLYINYVLEAHNLAVDWFTILMCIYNFGVMGLMAIHWKGPLRVQQSYHIFISALMALILIKNLPDWTGWMLLAGIAIYDLFAVLCPGGPLKQLLETAQERDEPIFPALIYSSAMVWITMADVDQQPQRARDVASFQRGHHDDDEPAISRGRVNSRAAMHVDDSPVENLDDEEEDAGGVKLGLGDFIFYSVLVGKAATSDDWGTIMACYIGIIVGLVCTLFILSVFQKALPALPISIAFGIFFFFTTSQMITPMCTQLAQDLGHM